MCTNARVSSERAGFFGKFKSLIRAQSHGCLFSSGQSSCSDPTVDLSLGSPVRALHPLARIHFDTRVFGKLAILITGCIPSPYDLRGDFLHMCG